MARLRRWLNSVVGPRGSARPIFVFGCPRSGTTVIGSYVGTTPGVCDLGEYGGFYLALHHAPRELGRAPSPVRESYQTSLEEHALRFPAAEAAEADCPWYVDDTPWNLLVADQLLRLVPDALLVLCLRDFRGVIQSLRRSYDEGYYYAGPTWEDSAGLWARFNEQALTLPDEQTIVVSYDRLCDEPSEEVDRLDLELSRHGLQQGRSVEVFAHSHAVPDGSERPTVLHGNRFAGTLEFRPRARYDRAAWPDEIERSVAGIVGDVDARLRERFPSRCRWDPPDEQGGAG